MMAATRARDGGPIFQKTGSKSKLFNYFTIDRVLEMVYRLEQKPKEVA